MLNRQNITQLFFDISPALSDLGQTSQVLRYVVIDSDVVSIQESFIDFIDVQAKRIAKIAKMILDKLISDELDYQLQRPRVQ